MKLDEQVILITGGASGIGRQIVEDLLPDARKLVVIDKNTAALGNLQSEHSSIGCYVCDLTDPQMVQRTIESIYNQQPSVTVLVNNAGFIHSEPLVNLLAQDDKKHDLQNWHKTIDTNLNTVFYVTSNVVENMVENRTRGLIVNISSISAHGNAGQSAYSAAKAAVNALTVTWSKELGMFGIRSAAIAPGFVNTPSTRGSLSKAQIQRWEKSTPLARLGNVNEITQSVRFIIENDFFNGRILEVDGGLKI